LLRSTLSICRPSAASSRPRRRIDVAVQQYAGLNEPVARLGEESSSLPSAKELLDLNLQLAVLVHLSDAEPCDDVAAPVAPPLDILELKDNVQKRTDPR